MSAVWVEDLSLDGATVGVLEYPGGFKAVCITDRLVEQYRILLSPTEDGAVSVGVSLEIFDDRPGELANFTHEKYIDCAVSDALEINDSGLFSAQSRASTARRKWSGLRQCISCDGIVAHSGFTWLSSSSKSL